VKILIVFVMGLMMLSLTSCGVPWKAYNDTDWGYSLQYPTTWEFTVEQNQPANSNFQSVLISGKNAQAAITCRYNAPGTALTLPNSVDYTIYEGQKNYDVYTVLSRQNSDREDVDEAIMITTLEQYNESSPLMKIKKLVMATSNGYYYRIEVQTKASEYDSYSAIIDKMINSFQVNGSSTPSSTGTQPTSLFPFSTYVNSEYGFSFKYPGTWVEKTTGLPAGTVKDFGVGAWFHVPCVWFAIIDHSFGATLQDAFNTWEISIGNMPGTFLGSDLTIDGVACTKADVTYTNANGDCNGTIVGFTRDGEWVIIGVIALPSIGGNWENATQCTDIINTVTLQ
jgi:hypothetical protein